jgi:hypothetical protein
MTKLAAWHFAHRPTFKHVVWQLNEIADEIQSEGTCAAARDIGATAEDTIQIDDLGEDEEIV